MTRLSFENRTSKFGSQDIIHIGISIFTCELEQVYLHVNWNLTISLEYGFRAIH